MFDWRECLTSTVLHNLACQFQYYTALELWCYDSEMVEHKQINILIKYKLMSYILLLL